jgi:hypothetical protein
MDQSFLFYPAKTDLEKGVITLTKSTDPSWKAEFTVQRPDANRLTLDGTLDGRHIRMDLQHFDHTKMLLLTRGFNWIQEYPFNR